MYDLEDFHSIVLARQEENLDCEVKIKENFALSISILFGSLHSLLLEKVEWRIILRTWCCVLCPH